MAEDLWGLSIKKFQVLSYLEAATAPFLFPQRSICAGRVCRSVTARLMWSREGRARASWRGLGVGWETGGQGQVCRKVRRGCEPGLREDTAPGRGWEGLIFSVSMKR